MDLKQDEAQKAADDLVSWFGKFMRPHLVHLIPTEKHPHILVFYCFIECIIDLVDHGDIEPGEVTAIGIGCDVANEESVKEGFEKIVKRFGKVDALVASAGACFSLSFPYETLNWHHAGLGIVENYSAFEQVGFYFTTFALVDVYCQLSDQPHPAVVRYQRAWGVFLCSRGREAYDREEREREHRFG